jgi:putative flippase GtrA
MAKNFSLKFKLINSKIHEYIKFNIVGISNFWVSQIFYLTLYLGFKINYIIAYTITSALSITASYFLNSKITFKNQNFSLKKFLLTFIVYLFEYVLNMFVIIFLVKYLHMSKALAPILAPVVSTPPVFFLMRSIIKSKN